MPADSNNAKVTAKPVLANFVTGFPLLVIDSINNQVEFLAILF
jgi:hypothetical protein